MKNYLLLGRLPLNVIEFFLKEILKRKTEYKSYQWVLFDSYLNEYFLSLFENNELKIQWDYRNSNPRPIQKAFYSDPGYGYRIHKDGLRCRSALNIALSCNAADWVRWYDEDYINSLSPPTSVLNNGYATSRDVDIHDYETVDFIEETKTSVGDVYIVNTDTYHSFKCNGPLPRIIIQTKFEDFPDFDTISESLQRKSFKNLIK